MNTARSRVSRQVVVAVHVIAIATDAAAVTGCGGKDSDSGSEQAASDPVADATDEAEPKAKPTTAHEVPAGAAYLVLRDKGLVAIEHSRFRTIVEDKYVGGRTMARKSGGLWVYVDDRMARYDDELTPLPDAPAKLGAVAVGPDETLWVSGKGLASYDGKSWKKHALPSALRNSFVRSLVFAADGARYGVAGGVLVAGRRDTWTALTAGAPSVRDVALAGDGTIYVSLRGQVARLAHDKLVPIATLKGDTPSLVTAPDGTVHVFNLEGAHRIVAGKLEPLGNLPAMVGQVFGADGALYGIPTDGMRIVRRRPDGRVDKLPAHQDLPFKVRSITVDAADRLWLVLEHGIAVLGRRGPPTLLMPGDMSGLPRDVEAIIVTGGGPFLLDILDVRARNLLTRLTSAIASAERLTLHEGLPHQREERALMEAERRSKPVQELHGYWFYKEPLAPSAEDVKRLTQVLSTPATFKRSLGGKLCGGFHPDYAIEWQQGSSVYRVLLCFGCREAELIGHGIAERYDLKDADELVALLSKYRKNRPLPSQLCEWLSSQRWGLEGELRWPAQLAARNPRERFLFALECAGLGNFR